MAALGISIIAPTSIFSLKGMPSCRSSRLALLEHGVGLAQLLHARDHRVHHAHVAHRARAQDGAELRLEDIEPLQAEADRPPAEEGIELLGQIAARS